MSTWNDLSQKENSSEWIKKFSGKIVDRTILDDNTTSIMAKDRAYNYDEFLDFIDMPQYPANAREVAIKCANHLGLTLDNPNDIINQHVVEFPNVLTVVQVLQNIAGLSGGNFIITEDDKLRLVATKRRNMIADDFSDFTPYQGATVTRNKTFPIEVFKGGRNYLLNSDERVDFEEQDIIPTTVGEYLPTVGGRNLIPNSGVTKQFTEQAPKPQINSDFDLEQVLTLKCYFKIQLGDLI